MSHSLHVHIWFASVSRMAHFEKIVQFDSVPRIGESLQFSSPAISKDDLWPVSEVVHRESGPIEIWTPLLNSRPEHMYSFEFEVQFDEYFESFSEAGWSCSLGIKKNVLFPDPS